MKKEKSCGAVVYRDGDAGMEVLLIKHKNGGHWAFPKGHVEKKETEAQKEALEKEKRLQKAMLDFKKRYGKNAILKGSNLQEGATAQHRNSQIGGHRA